MPAPKRHVVIELFLVDVRRGQQFEHEARFRRRPLITDVPTHSPGEIAGDGEAETHASDEQRPVSLMHEPLEQNRFQLRRNAFAMVNYRYLNHLTGRND